MNTIKLKVSICNVSNFTWVANYLACFCFFVTLIACEKEEELTATTQMFEIKTVEHLKNDLPTKLEGDTLSYLFTAFIQKRNSNETRKQTILVIPNKDYSKTMFKLASEGKYNEALDNLSGVILVYSDDEKNFDLGSSFFEGKWNDMIEIKEGKGLNPKLAPIICHTTTVYSHSHTDWYQYDPVTGTRFYIGTSYNGVTVNHYSVCFPSGLVWIPHQTTTHNHSIGTVNHIIDNISSSYPCAKSVLSDFPSIQSELTDLINTVFNNNEEVKLTVQTGNAGSGNAGTASSVGHPIYNFETTVTLDPNKITCTKDYILAVIIHEAIHGYIDYHRALVTHGQMSQTAFNAMFPIYASTLTSGGTVSQAQHNQMASNYVQQMASVLMAYNPNLTQTVAEALAWEGLQGTPAWNNLSSTIRNNIGLINMDARCEAPAGYTTNNNFKDC